MTDPIAPPSRYAAGPAADIVARDADDLVAIYHRRSGQTHVVAPVMLAIVEVLHDRALDLAGVVSALAESHDLDAEDDVAAVVAARLDDLHRLGLVEIR